jgi:hypothetical protein
MRIFQSTNPNHLGRQIVFSIVLGACWLIAPTVTAGDETLEKIVKIIRSDTKEHAKALAKESDKIAFKLKRFKAGFVNTNAFDIVVPVDYEKSVLFPSQKIKDKAIADLKESLASAQEIAATYKNEESYIYPRMGERIGIGSFGKQYSESSQSIAIRQVLDKSTSLVDFQFLFASELMMMKNMSTKDFVDGKSFSLEDNQIFEITDTATYTTVRNATKKVYVVEPINMKKLAEMLAKTKGK